MRRNLQESRCVEFPLSFAASLTYWFIDFTLDNFSLGKLVFAEPVPKDNEAASWREKLDQLYKSSSQSFRVVIHGSKVYTPLWSILD